MYFSVRSESTRVCLPSTRARMSTGVVEPVSPGNRDKSAAVCRASAAASSAFDGTHPVLTHVPPTVPFSTLTQPLPLQVARHAAANAALRAPINPGPPLDPPPPLG